MIAAPDVPVLTCPEVDEARAIAARLSVPLAEEVLMHIELCPRCAAYPPVDGIELPPNLGRLAATDPWNDAAMAEALTLLTAVRAQIRLTILILIRLRLPGVTVTIEVLTAVEIRIEDRDAEVQLAAVETLVEIGRVHPPLFPAVVARLTRGLRHESIALRCHIAFALGRLPGELRVIEILTAGLLDPQPPVRAAALAALSRIAATPPTEGAGSADTPPPDHTDPGAGGTTSSDAGGTHLDELRDALSRLVLDTSIDVRRALTAALPALRHLGVDAAAALLKLIDDADWEVRRRAAGSLGHLGDAAPEIISALRARLADERRVVAVAARAALDRLQAAGPSAPVVPE